MERKLYKLVKKLAILYYRFLCLVLPVNQKRVVFDSSLGKSYAGNPKYIYEYLVPMAMISSGTVSGFMKKTNTIYPA